MDRTDALDLTEIANEFTAIETSGAGVSLGSLNLSSLIKLRPLQSKRKYNYCLFTF